MAVLVEMISLIIRKDSMSNILFSDQVLEILDYSLTNPSCMDKEILCIHFNSPDAVGELVDILESYSLVWDKDFVIVDQNSGPTTECNWIQYAHTGGDEQIAICDFYDGPKDLGPAFYLKPDKKLQIYFPRGWEYEGSMSEDHTFIPLEP